MKPKQKSLSIVIVTFQGAECVRGWVESLCAQSYPMYEVIIIDNSIDDSTFVEMQKITELPITIFRQEHNLDFAQGYNLGMQESRGEYVCIFNQDIILEPRAIEELVSYLDEHPGVAAASPALLRLGSSIEHPVIDSLGISVSYTRSFRNIGEGKARALPTAPQSVFGLTGAAICFRRSALDALYAAHKEYFDADFIAYQEDVDISYRLRHLGYDLVVVPSSIGYYERSAQEKTKLSIVRAQRQKSFRTRGNSFKNHYWVLLKNEPWSTLLIHAPFILITEFLRFCFILCFQPSTLRIVPTMLREFLPMLSKRKRIQRSSVISPSQLRLWIQ